MSVAGDDLHIDAPELLTAPERARDTVFTALMWVFYLYLWVPLVSLFAWWLGFEFAYDVMIRSGGSAELRNVLLFYVVVIATIFTTVATWSLLNLLRYGKLSRRQPHETTTTDEIAQHFGLDDGAVDILRNSRSVAIEFDDGGRPMVERRAEER